MGISDDWCQHRRFYSVWPRLKASYTFTGKINVAVKAAATAGMMIAVTTVLGSSDNEWVGWLVGFVVVVDKSVVALRKIFWIPRESRGKWVGAGDWKVVDRDGEHSKRWNLWNHHGRGFFSCVCLLNDSTEKRWWVLSRGDAFYASGSSTPLQ